MHLQKKYKHAVRKQKNPCQSVLTLLGEVTDARAEWEETFDALTDGVSIHAPSGKIKRANASLAQMFDRAAESLVGTRCCELYHNSKKPRPDCTIMRTVTEPLPQRPTASRILTVENNRSSGVMATVRLPLSQN